MSTWQWQVILALIRTVLRNTPGIDTDKEYQDRELLLEALDRNRKYKGT